MANQSYLPFKVNATGVMPLIFASSLLALPSALARYTVRAQVQGRAPWVCRHCLACWHTDDFGCVLAGEWQEFRDEVLIGPKA